MGILFAAASKTLQSWGADVGLGKHLFAVGYTEDQSAEDAVAGRAGQTDWKILKAEEIEGLVEEEVLARLSRKEKAVDPNYYPKLRGAKGIFKVAAVNVENALVVAYALENQDAPKALKVKPADFAAYLLRNARG